MSESPIDRLNRVKREQIELLRDETDVGSEEPWKTAEWKEKRNRIINDHCEWCHKSSEDATALQLHHYDEPEFNYDREWSRAENAEFFESSVCDPRVHLEEPENCPNCLSTNFYGRKTKQPTYRCRRCQTEFPEAESASVEQLVGLPYASTYGTTQMYHDKADWVENNKETVRERMKDAYQDHWEEYLSLENTITICQTCHFMHHEHGQKICDVCEDEYGRNRSEYDEDWVCWDCVVDREGLALCRECGDNYYSPSQYDFCASCR